MSACMTYKQAIVQLDCLKLAMRLRLDLAVRLPETVPIPIKIGILVDFQVLHQSLLKLRIVEKFQQTGELSLN